MFVYVSLLCCVLGALIYGFAMNAKLAEIGRNMFWVGLLVFLLRFDEAIKLFAR